MLPKFYKITSLEKKNFYTGFQQATQLSFTGFSSHWKYRLGVSVGLPTHCLLVGVGVCHKVFNTIKENRREISKNEFEETYKNNLLSLYFFILFFSTFHTLL